VDESQLGRMSTDERSRQGSPEASASRVSNSSLPSALHAGMPYVSSGLFVMALLGLLDRLEALSRLSCPAGCCFVCLAGILGAVQKEVRQAAEILVVVPGGFKIEQGSCRSCSRRSEIFCMTPGV
jgi:hypothetical protein